MTENLGTVNGTYAPSAISTVHEEILRKVMDAPAKPQQSAESIAANLAAYRRTR